MKKLLVCFALTGLLAGCATTPGGKGFFVHPSTVSTNEAGVVTTNLAPGYIVNPGIANTLGTAQQIVGSAPVPWAPLATGALAVLSAVLGVIAKVKSDKASILPAVIAGVEAAANNADVKKAIQVEATAQGVQTALHAEVRRITG